jgi:hypothetical protein
MSSCPQEAPGGLAATPRPERPYNARTMMTIGNTSLVRLERLHEEGWRARS